MIQRKKSFEDVTAFIEEMNATLNVETSDPADPCTTTTADIAFPAEGNATDIRRFDLSSWHGKGFDKIILLCQQQIEIFTQTKDGILAVATIAGYCYSGLKQFFDHLQLLAKSYGRTIEPRDINRELIDGFIANLHATNWQRGTQKKYYDAVKAVLKAIAKRGLLNIVSKGPDATFPKRPFSRQLPGPRGAEPLSPEERKSFSAAVKSAVMPLFSDDAEVTGELLAFALLLIALHTGRNTTPLLELSIDCLQPHPKDDLYFLVTHKRRGNSISKVPVSKPKELEEVPVVYPGVSKVIARVVTLTEPLRSKCPTHLRHRLWIYESQDSRSKNVTVLSPSMLSYAANKLVSKHKLVQSDGAKLEVNVGRLRKTFANKMFESLGGDIKTVAAALGNTPKVTDRHYLRPPESAKQNWRLMGIVLTSELLHSTLGATEKTPTGRCTDPKRGQFAPKVADGVCHSFLDCVRCRNYVVTEDDLYRLFSFYFRVFAEREIVGKERWEKYYRHITRIIDRDIIEHGITTKSFKVSDVEKARELARRSPHPFWKHMTLSSNH